MVNTKTKRQKITDKAREKVKSKTRDAKNTKKTKIKEILAMAINDDGGVDDYEGIW